MGPMGRGGKFRLRFKRLRSPFYSSDIFEPDNPLIRLENHVSSVRLNMQKRIVVAVLSLGIHLAAADVCGIPSKQLHWYVL